MRAPTMDRFGAATPAFYATLGFMKIYVAIAMFGAILGASARAGDWVCQGVCGYSTGNHVFASQPLTYGQGEDPSVTRAFDLALQQCASTASSPGNIVLVSEIFDRRGYVHYIPVAIAQACVRN
jgi:hypothetical protein